MMNKKSGRRFSPVLLDGEEKESILYSITAYVMLFLTAALLLFVTFFQLCLIEGSSMENTMRHHDDVLVTRYGSTYKYLDIVILKEVKSDKENIIKRVIATAGETVRFEIDPDDSDYMILKKKPVGGDFVTLDESSYIKWKMEKTSIQKLSLNQDIVVPEKHIFFLGDNRNNSSDSRYYGTCSIDKIIGKVVYISPKGTFINGVLNLIFNRSSIFAGDGEVQGSALLPA